MAMKPWTVLIAAFAFTGPTEAQTPQGGKNDPQSTFEPRSGPGTGQKFLSQMVGEWDVAKTFYPRSGGEPARATGVCRQTMIHDGRFLQSEFVFGAGDAKTTGLGLIGFDPAAGIFTSVWTDSRQTRMSFRQGKEKFDGKRIVLYSEALGGGSGGRRSKTATELTDNGNRIVHRQFGMGGDGPERLVMELVMTRKPAASASPATGAGK
jgi:Protein of unknown function (DUF1579)